MKKTLSNLGEKLKQARMAAGLSQKELGDQVRLSDKAISAYEVGRAQPSVEALRSVSQVVDRPLAYFLDDAPADDEQELAFQLKKIEKELAEIKLALQKKGYQL